MTNILSIIHPDKLNELDELDELDEFNELDELDELDEFNELDEFDEFNELDELNNKLDEFDEFNKLDELNNKFDELNNKLYINNNNVVDKIKEIDYISPNSSSSLSINLTNNHSNNSTPFTNLQKYYLNDLSFNKCYTTYDISSNFYDLLTFLVKPIK